MSRFFAIVLFCIVPFLAYWVMEADAQTREWKTYVISQGVAPLSPDAARLGPQVYWRHSARDIWVRTMQFPPGHTTWASGGMFRMRTGPRSWPDHTETIIAFGLVGDPVGGSNQLSLPFSLPTILTTLAPLFLTAGVWLLWRDRKRRLWQVAAQTKHS